jgi:hypothetical protein
LSPNLSLSHNHCIKPPEAGKITSWKQLPLSVLKALEYGAIEGSIGSLRGILQSSFKDVLKEGDEIPSVDDQVLEVIQRFVRQKNKEKLNVSNIIARSGTCAIQGNRSWSDHFVCHTTASRAPHVFVCVHLDDEASILIVWERRQS